MKNMTADKKARLDDLSARDGELNDVELKELAFLQALAEADSDSEAEEGEEAPDDAADGEGEGEGEAEEVEGGSDTEDGGAEASGGKKKLNIFQKAEAVLKSRSALVGSEAEAREKLKAADEEIASLKAENAKLAEEAKQGRALAKRVAELEHEQTTVSKKAATIAANNHVSDEDLPPKTEEMESLEEMREQIRTCTDLKEKARLLRRAKELREAEFEGSRN